MARSPEARAQDRQRKRDHYWRVVRPERYGNRPPHQKSACACAEVAPSVADLAWAAGFLEGEGNFSVNHKHRLHNSQVVRATQKNLEPLYRLRRIFGGTVKPVRSDSFGEWRSYGARARGIMYTMFSFLSARKRAQILDALGV